MGKGFRLANVRTAALSEFVRVHEPMTPLLSSGRKEIECGAGRAKRGVDGIAWLGDGRNKVVCVGFG
jgi:hypothetical protein